MTSTTREGARVRVFGGIGVDDAGEPVSIGGPRQRRLLALLGARPGSVVSNDWLAEHLWKDDERPAAVAPVIRTYMSRLRQSLPEVAQEWIETESSGYRWVGPPDAIEHRRFSLLRAEATTAREREDPQTANRLLDEALGLWRGDPFRELEDLDWARAEIEQLRLDRLEMLEERWEVALALGRHTQITGELAAFTAEHGLRERAAQQYALALHRSGRTTEALRVIDEHRRKLVEQGGLGPSRDILEFEKALLAGDPSLDVVNIGRPLRGYQLIEEVGTGAFSIVWRGMQPSVGREVAIKQIRSELASQPDFIRRFEAEAHLVARIEHPHIVPLIDFWRDPDSAYLVMRWLGGGTLERRLDEGPLTVEESITLAQQIGGALSAAHRHGIVHRDVKASNILFDETGNAFLGDFGIALETARSGGPEAALSQGSPAYASPEQIRREGLGPAADVFSLGVVIFECLVAHLPFADATTLQELIDRQLHDPYPSLSELRTDVPVSVADAVATATAKHPEDRFSSVAEFVDALVSRTASVARVAVGADLDNPYNGLRAFDDGDSDRFFGRESLLSELVGRLSGQTVKARVVVVVGPSGSGKSSVVRAGLLPALRAGAVRGSDDWFVTTMVPGTDPYESLEAALLRVAVNPPASLIEQLRGGPRGILRSVRRCLRTDENRVVVFIDQFEEIFTGPSADRALDFLDALSVAVTDPTSPLRLIIALRADYYHRPLEHRAFAKIVNAAAVNVVPLAADELERAIVEPARRLGVEFEPGLVARIAAETIGQPSPLPMLQYTLSELFEGRTEGVLTAEAYDDLGGLTGALAARAEALYDEAGEAERAAIRRIFGRMINPGEESADLRRRVPIADIGLDDPSEWVLESFGAARLITFDRDVTTREPTVEVAHEALLREWPRLVAWLEEDSEVLRHVDAVAGAATAWIETGRPPTDLYRGVRLEQSTELALAAPDRFRPVDEDFLTASRSAAEAERITEQRRVRRLRRLVVGVAAALVVALVAGGIAFRQRDDAQAATEAAELATIISRSAALVDDDPAVSILLALEAHRRSPGPDSEQAVLNALGSTTTPNRISSIPRMEDPSGACDLVLVAGDGSREFMFANEQMISRNPVTGASTDHGPAPAPCGVWSGDAQLDRKVAATDDGLRVLFGPYDGDWDVELEFDEPTYPVSTRFTSAHRFALLTPGDDYDLVRLVDDRTGEQVGPDIVGGINTARASSPDGSLIALGFSVGGLVTDGGLTVVLDAATGEQLLRRVDTPPAAFLFDDVAGELISFDFGGFITTVDIASGDIVRKFPTAATSLPLQDAIGIRDDGLITVVSGRQIEVVDRVTGPTGRLAEVRNVESAVVRPDGTVLIDTTDGQVEIIDLEGSALIEDTYEIERLTAVSFNAGRAAIVGERVETIDLSTGSRNAFDLISPDGDRYSPDVAYAEVDGLWEVAGGVVSRWVGPELVEQIDVAGSFTGTRYLDLFAVVLRRPRGTVVRLLNLEPGATRLEFEVSVPNAATAHPTLDGGVHVLDAGGTLFTFDASGQLVAEVETGAENVRVITIDATTARLAMVPAEGGVVLVDPVTGEIEVLPNAEPVGNLGFARDGQLLAITSRDGSVRLWDITRGVFGGLVWRGSGSVNGSPSWYDEATDSIWVSTSGKLLRVPLDPQGWVDRACEIVGRPFTEDEWERFVPGDDPLETACP